MSNQPALDVRNLSVSYRVGGEALPALRSVDVTLHRGEVIGVVGESGCGKSTLSLALLGLLPDNGTITGGQILLDGHDLTDLGERQLRALRGPELAMIFQDPSTSLNPTFKVGVQLREILRAHGHLEQGGSPDRRAAETLAAVGLPEPVQIMQRYPHELSGGMQQRVMIAFALMLRPSVLVADEPTSALDVTLQAQILRLIRQLSREFQTGTLLISHDLGAVTSVCDRVVVMYGGEAVETGSVDDLFRAPLHPYTRALLRSVPSRRERGRPLAGIPGRVPPLNELPRGCVFADRCLHAREVCTTQRPAAVQVGSRSVACLAFDGSSSYGQPPEELRRAAGGS